MAISVRYAVVDAFTDTPFKGNPAAVCLLEEGAGVNEEWMQNVSKEFNFSQTAFLVPSTASTAGVDVSAFQLRWFTPVGEVKLCGHATLASAYFLFTTGIAKGEVIEFTTLSGILTAKKVLEFSKLGSVEPCNDESGKFFSIELDFPIVQVMDCASNEIPSFPETLKDLSIVNVQKTTSEDLIVELASGKDLVDVKPNFFELGKYSGRGVILTAPAPPGTEFDFFTRFFCPKMGINEDPVCGSAHCALAPYWSHKLGKQNLIAYQLEVFKKALMESLQEESESPQVGTSGMAQMKISKVSSLSSGSLLGEADSLNPPPKSPTASETGYANSTDGDSRDVDASKLVTLRGFDLPSNGGTPRFTPPGSPPRLATGFTTKRLSRPLSPKRHSNSVATTRNAFDNRLGMFSSIPATHNSTPSPYDTEQTGRTRIDGKEFFRQVRSRLSYEQFSSFLSNVKELNSQKQTRAETLRKAGEIFGPDNKDLYTIFEGLINRNLH